MPRLLFHLLKMGLPFAHLYLATTLLAGNPQQKVSVDSFHLKNEVSLHRSEWNHALGSIELENINLEGLLQGTPS